MLFSFIKNIKRAENGSAFFIILVAVVLFSALTYALSRGGDSTRNLSEERIQLLATELIDTGGRIHEIVARLALHGVTDTELSFEYNGQLSNAGCGEDRCKIFAYDGGGGEWEAPPIGSNNGEGWVYSGDHAVLGIGTDAADLIMVLPDLPLNLCQRVNVMSGIGSSTTSPPALPAILLSNFVGSYDATPVTLNDPMLSGRKSGCFISKLTGPAVPLAPANVDIYNFYYVLMAR